MDTNKKIGCMQGCLISVCILMAFVVGFFAIVIWCIKGCSGDINIMNKKHAASNLPVDECGSEFTERWSAGCDGKDAEKVVRIRLSGVISREQVQSFFAMDVNANSAPGARDRIRAAKNDKNVRAIILEINSPGGEVTMSDLVWHELQEFRSSSTNRLVFAHLMDMACSGGYYIAAAADYIYALPTTVTGSIGVVVPAINASGLAEKIGIKPVSIASSENKDLLNPLMPTNPEHVAIVKKTVDETYERFVGIVANGRKLPMNKVKAIADGRILSAQAALESKLIDGIGYENDLLKFVSEKLGGKVKVVKYEKDFSFENLFLDGMTMRLGEYVKQLIMFDLNTTPTMQFR